MKVKYEDIKKLSQFKEENGVLRWHAITIGHWIDSIDIFIEVSEGEDGYANISYKGKYSKNKDFDLKKCIEPQYIDWAKDDLELLLGKYNIKYERS